MNYHLRDTLNSTCLKQNTELSLKNYNTIMLN